MAHVCARLYYHFVWATWDREPLLVGDIEHHAYALIQEQCLQLDVSVLAIGGVADHVHLLVSLPRTCCIADFMESIKGCSSRTLNEAHATSVWSFKWQGGYGVITVSPGHLQRVKSYVENQKQHHDEGTLRPAAERCREDE